MANTSCRFTETEKAFVVQLVAENKDILENKRTDGATIKQKNEVWARIEQLFCSQGFPAKNVRQLKKCWDNIKQKARQQNTVARQNQLLTGGGPPENLPKDPITELAAAAISNLDYSFENKFDSDAGFGEQREVENIADPASSGQIPSDPSERATTERASRKRSIYSEDSENEGSPRKQPEVKKIKCSCRDQLMELHLKKARDAILQQQELHDRRMETAEMERRIVALKLRKLQENVP